MLRFHVITAPRSELRLAGAEFGVPAVVNLAAVDWEREFALVADMGEQRTGGHGLVLRQVSVADGDVTVELEVRRPGPGSFVVQALTHPALLVRVPRAALAAGARLVVRDQDGRTLATLQPGVPQGGGGAG